MRLTLFGWPPVASHLACLLLGTSAAHLLANTGAPRPRVDQHAILVPAPHAAVGRIPPGTKVQVLRGEGDSTCRMTAEPAMVTAADPTPALQVAGRDAAAVARIFEGLHAKSLRLEAAQGSGARPACALKGGPKIKYGG